MTKSMRSSLKSVSSDGEASKRDDSESSIIVKMVQFEGVEIISFPLILGDNPSVSDGAPLTIGWKPKSREVENIDVYERERRGRRKKGKKLIISAKDRNVLLLSQGYKMQHLMTTAEEIEKLRKERIKSLQTKKRWDTFNGALEAAKKGFFKTLSVPALTATKDSEGGRDMNSISPRTA